MMFWGHFSIVYPKTHTPIVHVTGRPIHVPKRENFTEEDVEMLQNEFYEELVAAVTRHCIVRSQRASIFTVIISNPLSCGFVGKSRCAADNSRAS